MENLSLLLLFAKKSILVVGFVGIVSCGGLSGLFSKISVLTNDKGNEQIEWKTSAPGNEGNSTRSKPWWSFLF